MTAPTEPFDVVVVGGGQAGLAAGWLLRQRGLRFLVLEAAEELGHAWRTRWEYWGGIDYARIPRLPRAVRGAIGLTAPVVAGRARRLTRAGR